MKCFYKTNGSKSPNKYLGKETSMNNNSKLTEIYSTTPQHTKEQWDAFVEEFSKNVYLIPQDHNFVQNFINPLTERTITINHQKIYYRARINNTNPFRVFQDRDLKTPPSRKVNYGRLNRKGIPFLYIAQEKETAILEVRPYISAKVAIAEYRPIQPLEIVELTSAMKDTGLNNFRKLLGEKFSLPVNRLRAKLEYRATQYIAEYCRVKRV